MQTSRNADLPLGAPRGLKQWFAAAVAMAFAVMRDGFSARAQAIMGSPQGE